MGKFGGLECSYSCVLDVIIIIQELSSLNMGVLTQFIVVLSR